MTDPVGLSKRLAYVLRHNPAEVGIELDPAGWAELDELLDALSAHGQQVTRADVDTVLTAVSKQRFEVADGRIRATHGHSVEVDLGLEPAAPPDVLYHGTVARFLDAIHREGLQPRGRQHVHLSADVATARDVGGRRGRPVVLKVDAAALHATGQRFLRATEGVWLTTAVPPEHLDIPHAAGGHDAP